MIAIFSVLIILLVILHIIAFISYYHDQTTMKIFMKENISEEEIENIRNQIENQSKDAEITYISPEEKLEEMKEKFKENAYLLDEYEGEKNIFPAEFIIKTKSVQDIEKIEESLVNIEEIQKIQSGSSNNPYMALLSDCMEWYIDMRGPVSNGK